MLDLETNHYWMPFTSIKNFSKKPILVKEAKGMYYISEDGRKILDGSAGLWCVNAGHSRREIAEAVFKQASNMPYAPSFQLSHPLAFEFADKLSEITPKNLNKIFFVNSGSEAVDTALKIALAYFKNIGKGSKNRLIGREKGYHGVGFGGISVGGIKNNRKQFTLSLPFVDHLPHTLNSEHLFKKGLPPEDDRYSDALIDLINLHDASNIAAVIVEPIAGSAGVILPPQNYLKKIRKICDENDILLIFDEVITGFGRVGDSFFSTRFDVIPDIITAAKGLTNGAVPMGAVFVRDDIYNAFLENSQDAIEFFHGYTYSASPIACAAGIATFDIYQKEKLFERSKDLEDFFEKNIHSLQDHKLVKDIRNLGLIGAVELKSKKGAPMGTRGYEAFSKAFFDYNFVCRVTGDTLAFSPPLIADKSEISQIFSKVRAMLDELTYNIEDE